MDEIAVSGLGFVRETLAVAWSEESRRGSNPQEGGVAQASTLATPMSAFGAGARAIHRARELVIDLTFQPAPP